MTVNFVLGVLLLTCVIAASVFCILVSLRILTRELRLQVKPSDILLLTKADRELFEKYLNAQQQSELLESGTITVYGSRGGQYQVSEKNVTNKPFGYTGVYGHCIIPAIDKISPMDRIISKKLLIEADEMLFQQTAIMNGSVSHGFV